MSSQQQVIERLLTTKEVAELTGYAEATLRKWRVHGVADGPPFFKTKGRSGHVRYRASQIEAWLKKRSKTPVSLHD